MSREPVHTEKAPKAIGPYEQAIKANGMVYTSGQIPIDPKTGNFVAGGIKEQTRQVMENLQAVLEAAGSSLDRVVKATVFLKRDKRLRRHERNLRGVSWQRQAGKVDGRGGRFATRRAGGNRFGRAGPILNEHSKVSVTASISLELFEVERNFRSQAPASLTPAAQVLRRCPGFLESSSSHSHNLADTQTSPGCQ